MLHLHLRSTFTFFRGGSELAALSNHLFLVRVPETKLGRSSSFNPVVFAVLLELSHVILGSRSTPSIVDSVRQPAKPALITMGVTAPLAGVGVAHAGRGVAAVPVVDCYPFHFPGGGARE